MEKYSYICYAINPISKVPVKDSNNNTILGILKQELENNTIIEKKNYRIKLMNLKITAVNCRMRMIKLKKDFDEYKVTHPKNLGGTNGKTHKFKSATKN